MSRRLDDAIGAADPGDRMITLIVLALMVIVLAGLLFVGGSIATRNHFIAQCEKGTKFYALGDPDVPYRCTRVIDYPPQRNP